MMFLGEAMETQDVFLLNQSFFVIFILLVTNLNVSENPQRMITMNQTIRHFHILRELSIEQTTI